MDVFQAGADDCREGVQSSYKSTVNASHLTLPEMIKKLDKAVKNPTINLAHWCPRTETRVASKNKNPHQSGGLKN